MAVWNDTLPDHIFWKGEVERSVIVDGGQLKIRTHGTGYNTTLFRWGLNYVGGATAFRAPDWKIAQYVKAGGR